MERVGIRSIPSLYTDEDIDFRLVVLLVALGHDVLTTQQVRRRGTGDEEQLVYASSLDRILLTRNGGDFKLLHRAWNHWTGVWSVQPPPIHAGLLVVPQVPVSEIERLARAIDAFVQGATPLVNRLHEWKAGRGWILIE